MSSERTTVAVFRIRGMDCAEEVATLKAEIGPLVGGEQYLSFDIVNGKMRVDATQASVEAIEQAVAATGMSASPWTDDAASDEQSWWQRRGRAVMCLASAVLLVAAVLTHALAAVQAQAPGWGGDPSRVVLMGHSAGAHLVALLSASPALAREGGARPWSATVALDSAALDTEALMQRRHMPMYDRAFGSDPAQWRAVSPMARLAPGGPPLLLVCSSVRRDDPCAQSRRLADAVRAQGGVAQVLPQPLPHGQINGLLGLPGPYTQAVDAFIDAHLTRP